jgi:glutamine cyclotransferase
MADRMLDDLKNKQTCLLNAVVAACAALMLASRARAEPAVPLRAGRAISLPGVAGRIDHLAIDVAGQRLFLAALGNGSLEVLDLRAGQRLRSVAGLEEPQGVAFLSGLHEVVVATAGGAVVAFDDRSFATLGRIPGMEDADNVRVDASTHQLYVGHGEGGLALFDPSTLKRLADIQLPGHPESFQLEQGSPRLYVNVPRTKEVVVVDRQRGIVIGHIPLGDSSKNYPMSLDEARHRLFVGVRAPAKVLVIDTQSGQRVGQAPCVGDADDMFHDPDRQRVYVIGGEGFVDVFDVQAPDRPVRVARLPTAAGARTGLWSPALRQLFVAAPRRDGHAAAVQVFQAGP